MLEVSREAQFILNDTYESSMEPIKKCFDLYPQEHDRLHITLDRNIGGNLVPVLELIEMIRNSEINVSISVKRYIFSAAAYLYFYLFFEKERGRFENVSFVSLEEPILVLFHKPRNVERKFVRFPDSKKPINPSSIPLDIEGGAKFVEKVFRRFLESTGNSEIEVVPKEEGFENMKHINQHVLDAWENNYDCIFHWEGRAIPQEETAK